MQIVVLVPPNMLDEIRAALPGYDVRPTVKFFEVPDLDEEDL